MSENRNEGMAPVAVNRGAGMLWEQAGRQVTPTDAPALADTVDMSPARWIWLPSERTLPNTVVLLRREMVLSTVPARATIWLTADSRYRFCVNGRRVGWGPAPCDPRHLDVDRYDLTPYLQDGLNVLAAEVLYFGHGDGTWAAGKPGFLCRVMIEDEASGVQEIFSDSSWLTYLDRAFPPGQYKRWFLRALQEEFDARFHPEGWDRPGFRPDTHWIPAMELDCPASKPASCSTYRDYLHDLRMDLGRSALHERSLPPLRETEVSARLRDSGTITWHRDPRDWFEMRMPGSFVIEREPILVEQQSGRWEVPALSGPGRAVFATFELHEQVVGWPYITLEAAEGTIVEVISQEAHDPQGPAWLDSQFYCWSRFICRSGVTRFEAFDFESLRWLQLHIHNTSEPVIIHDVGVRRRQYPWPHDASVRCGDPALDRLFGAAINTLQNSAQETIVDGMARERQQYSGDCGHQIHAIRYVFGETELPRRFLRTYSQGFGPEGYVLDAWPAHDRLVRVAQRHIDGTPYGPLLDQGVGFGFDCWHHYLESGDLDAVREPFPQLLRFADFLLRLRKQDGLLPVEGLGVPCVWIDHTAYRRQQHKQCAFNLYVAAMFEHALAPLARALGDVDGAAHLARDGRSIRDAAVEVFWDDRHGLFVCNRPWLAAEGQLRLCDRSLATSILYDQCPAGKVGPAVDALAAPPPELGLSYPANAGWRYWALARCGRIDVILSEFRHDWAAMPSVILNNTIAEVWDALPDSATQWSHCAVIPLYILAMDIVGLRPRAPGFTRYVVRPQLGDLASLDVTLHTPAGPLQMIARRSSDGLSQRVSLTTPPDSIGELVVPLLASVALPRLHPDHPLGLARYQLSPGVRHELIL